MATSRPSESPSIVPSVNPRKWTTQVNIAIAISVLVILVVGGVIAWSVGRRHRETPETGAATSLPIPPAPSSV